MTTTTTTHTTVTTAAEEVKYFLVFHDFAPELFPGVAFRRSRPPNMRLKLIKCPYCKARLLDIDEDAKVELFRYSKRSKVTCQMYRKCYSCQGDIGINIV